MAQSGTLTLIPTPLNEELNLEPYALDLLKEASSDPLHHVICVEELKPARRRWIKWGLPREMIDSFIAYNEHSSGELNEKLIGELKKGKNIYLMSDGGLPALMDPGQSLVHLCHTQNIKVTATAFANSIILALALSGMSHQQFLFLGFPPQKTNERTSFLKNALNQNKTVILMDTPYRLKKLLEEINEISPQKSLFLALNLNCNDEQTHFGRASDILKNLHHQKAEFILVIE